MRGSESHFRRGADRANPRPFFSTPFCVSSIIYLLVVISYLNILSKEKIFNRSYSLIGARSLAAIVALRQALYARLSCLQAMLRSMLGELGFCRQVMKGDGLLGKGILECVSIGSFCNCALFILENVRYSLAGR